MESRARCAGFSVTEIGNRKERLRDYASFPDRQPHRNPIVPIKKEVVSEQNAKHSTIETGLRRKACLHMQSVLNHLLLIPAMQFRVTPCGGWGYAPALQAGERAPLRLRGLGEDFDFSP